MPVKRPLPLQPRLFHDNGATRTMTWRDAWRQATATFDTARMDELKSKQCPVCEGDGDLLVHALLTGGKDIVKCHTCNGTGYKQELT